MVAKAKNFNELRRQARARDPEWDASVAERQRAIEDALALAQLLHPVRETPSQPGV